LNAIKHFYLNHCISSYVYLSLACCTLLWLAAPVNSQPWCTLLWLAAPVNSLPWCTLLWLAAPVNSLP
jgi:hypothetical protein